MKSILQLSFEFLGICNIPRGQNPFSMLCDAHDNFTSAVVIAKNFGF
jgi:hypothetical protein